MILTSSYVIADFGGRKFFRGNARRMRDAIWTKCGDKALRYQNQGMARRMAARLKMQDQGRDIQEISAQAAWALEQKWEREAVTDGESDAVNG